MNLRTQKHLVNNLYTGWICASELGEIGLIILQCKEISYIDVKKREKQRLGRGKSRSGKAMS